MGIGAGSDGVLHRLRLATSEAGIRSIWPRIETARHRIASGGARALPIDPADLRPVVDPPVHAIDPDGPLRIDWIVPPLSVGSGGHTNLLRLVAHAESMGHRCTLRFYDTGAPQPIERARTLLREHFPAVDAAVVPWDRRADDADVVVATSWPTAWSVAAAQTTALRTYLVQDYEPWFYPRGSHAAMAARTYELGLAGITLGPALTDELARRHDMACEWFPFAVDPSSFHREERATAARDGIVFYGRPETGRAGFELGCAALQLVADERPDIPVHVIGGTAPRTWFPASAQLHGVLDHASLNALYNRCRVGLVLSFTNLSMLPLELLAAGCMPVVNDGEMPRTTLGDAPTVYAPADPASLATAMVDAWDAHPEGAPPFALEGCDWATAGDAFLAGLRRHLAARAPLPGR